MKNLRLKDTLREISKTKARFFSIFAIVFIGVAMFSGIIASGPDMKFSADKYYDDYHLMDVRIISTLGLTYNDIQELKKINGVEGVQPTYTSDFLAQKDGLECVVRASSFILGDLKNANDNYLNRFVLQEGRMPIRTNECVMEKGAFLDAGFKVGDEITLYLNGGDEASLKRTTFKIVGLVNTPYYLSFDKGASDIGGGTVNTYMYIDQSNFDLPAYTEAFITFKNLRSLNSYKEEYFEALEPYTNMLQTFGIDRSQIRTDEVLDEANKALEDAEQQYDKGVKEFNIQITEAEQKIEQGEQEILLGKSQIATARIVLETTIQTSKVQIETIEAQIKNFTSQYDSYKIQFEEQEKTINKQKEAILSQNKTLESQLKEKQAAYELVNTKLDSLKAENEMLSNKYAEENSKLSSELSKPIEQQDAALIASLQESLSNISMRQTEILQEQIALEVSSEKLEYESLKMQVESNNATIKLLDDGLLSAKQIVNKLQGEIDKLYVQLNDAKNQLDIQRVEQEKTITANERKIKKGEKDLVSAKIELEKAKVEGQLTLDDAAEEIAKARLEVEAIEEARWYILDRNSHYSYVDYKGAAERMEAISAVFPVFFFLVAALVCSTTMTRFVDEQRLQIGTMKALGYGTWQIAFKYLFYAGSATLLGSVLGLLFGLHIFPLIIYTAWNMMYIMPGISYEVQYGVVWLSISVSFLINFLVTFITCWSELTEVPGSLMRPKAPKLGKKILLEKIPFIWNKMNFTSKVTARNIFRYKKRMLMTIIGISGCTALLIAGFGMKDSISDIVRIQFNDIFKHDATVSLLDNLNRTEIESVKQNLLDLEYVEDLSGVYGANATLKTDNKEDLITLVVHQNPEELQKFISLHDRITKEEYTLPFDGIIISEKIANDRGIKKGDTIEIMISQGITKAFEVAEIAENYVGHFIYMASTLYRDSFGVRPEINSFYLNCSEDINENELGLIVSNIDGVEAASFYNSAEGQFSDMIETLNSIIIVLIISAGALAFVVLYNLTNVNISERIREIATLKVLGFNKKEVEKYVFNENIILTFMGGIAGLFLGKALHYLIMVVVELDNVMFGRNVNVESYLISLILTMLFGFLVNHFMKNKLTKIPMVESLKSVE